MRIDLDHLPSDVAVLHRLIRDIAAVVEHRDGEIERLPVTIRKLQRAEFGRRSERLTSINSRSRSMTSTPTWPRLNPPMTGRRQPSN
jgi:hypothetical protein